MSDGAKYIVEAEGYAAGRVVPGWRITLIIVIVGLCIGFARALPPELWADLVIIVPASVAITVLLHPYRRRSVS